MLHSVKPNVASNEFKYCSNVSQQPAFVLQAGGGKYTLCEFFFRELHIGT